jgi:hypothetical protein
VLNTCRMSDRRWFFEVISSNNQREKLWNILRIGSTFAKFSLALKTSTSVRERNKIISVESLIHSYHNGKGIIKHASISIKFPSLRHFALLLKCAPHVKFYQLFFLVIVRFRSATRILTAFTRLTLWISSWRKSTPTMETTFAS